MTVLLVLTTGECTTGLTVLAALLLVLTVRPVSKLAVPSLGTQHWSPLEREPDDFGLSIWLEETRRPLATCAPLARPT